ncbi:MAG: hypothetical protein KBT06_04510 [Prevotellaceae bacterium]|nr:hypothetical protein [Candidatus Colivivens equi]
MALNKKDLITLAKTTAKADSSAKTAFSFNEKNFSYSQLSDTLRDELNEVAGSYQLYRENKNLLFTIMEETFDDVLPQKVLSQYGQFAEVRTFPQGTKAVWTQKITTNAKRRAKQFVTKVGLAGRYEVFKLDGKTYEVETSAFGGAAQIGFEEFLDGRVDFAEVTSIIMEGLDECVYLEIERALKAAVTSLGVNNKVVFNAFDEKKMDNLLQIVDSYGSKGTIYCTYEFAAEMVPAQTWAWSDSMKQNHWDNGYFTTYKGHNVIILPQSYEDETNSVKVIDPAYAWVIPSGAEKPVKIAFEGGTIVKDFENRGDYSREIQVYKKMGVTAIIENNIGVYINTSLKRQ